MPSKISRFVYMTGRAIQTAAYPGTGGANRTECGCVDYTRPTSYVGEPHACLVLISWLQESFTTTPADPRRRVFTSLCLLDSSEDFLLSLERPICYGNHVLVDVHQPHICLEVLEGRQICRYYASLVQWLVPVAQRLVSSRF